MAGNTRSIRAGRAFVEMFADDSKLVRGLRRAEKRLLEFRSGRTGCYVSDSSWSVSLG